jgi:hypothetical protein
MAAVAAFTIGSAVIAGIVVFHLLAIEGIMVGFGLLE